MSLSIQHEYVYRFAHKFTHNLMPEGYLRLDSLPSQKDINLRQQGISQVHQEGTQTEYGKGQGLQSTILGTDFPCDIGFELSTPTGNSATLSNVQRN